MQMWEGERCTYIIYFSKSNSALQFKVKPAKSKKCSSILYVFNIPNVTLRYTEEGNCRNRLRQSADVRHHKPLYLPK